MTDSRRGLILINTGPGKGKTTAAMGTALRAVGNGMKVLMLQFLKGSWHYGELDAVQAFGSNFVLKQMGRGFVKVGGAETDPEDSAGAGGLGRSAPGHLLRRVGHGDPGRDQLRHRLWHAGPRRGG
jgi:ATP:corrinoid adenosyltransferase